MVRTSCTSLYPHVSMGTLRKEGRCYLPTITLTRYRDKGVQGVQGIQRTLAGPLGAYLLGRAYLLAGGTADGSLGKGGRNLLDHAPLPTKKPGRKRSWADLLILYYTVEGTERSQWSQKGKHYRPWPELKRELNGRTRERPIKTDLGARQGQRRTAPCRNDTSRQGRVCGGTNRRGSAWLSEPAVVSRPNPPAPQGTTTRRTYVPGGWPPGPMGRTIGPWRTPQESR